MIRSLRLLLGRFLGIVLTIGAGAGTSAAVTPRRPAAEARPNIVLILADDLGHGDVSFRGRKEWSTPNIDRLASRGAVLSRCYAGAVVCAPSRAALLTGKDTIHNGVRRNDDDLPATEVTIAEALKARGYDTALFGKWHRGKPRPGAASAVHPLDQGFDEFFGFTDATHAWEKFPNKLWDGRKLVASSGHADDLFADKAVSFIGRHRGGDRPFFLYLPFIAPHFHVEAPADEVALHRGKLAEADPSQPLNATYAAMVTRLDRNVGRVLEALAANGVEGETLVVFASDHGATFEKGNLGTSRALDSNRPFRGQKRTLWEGGVRVPAIVAWPGRIRAGSVVDDPARLTDLFPTLLAASGGTPDPSWRVDGVDLLPTLLGGASLPDRALFWEWRSEGANQVAALRGRHKLVITGGGGPELYDVVADPGERADLAAGSPDLVRRLRGELEDWLATEIRR